MLKKEYQIIQPLVAQPWKKFTFKEIKEFSQKTSKSYIFSVLKKLTDGKIIQREKVGNLLLYQLNHTYLKAQVYASFVSEHLAWNKAHLPFSSLHKATARIPTHFYILVITGSYAKNTQKGTSDIDVVLIVSDSEDTQGVYAQLRSICELSVPEIHLYVFRRSEFLEMLLNEEANYGKEIVKNNLLLYGAEIYYQILSEAMEHGFTGKKLS